MNLSRILVDSEVFPIPAILLRTLCFPLSALFQTSLSPVLNSLPTLCVLQAFWCTRGVTRPAGSSIASLALAARVSLVAASVLLLEILL